MREVEFVTYVASATAMGVIATYLMMPALPEMAGELALSNPSSVQAVITAYLIGFASSQLVFGPLSDRFGRKSVILVGVAVYTLASAACAYVDGLAPLLVARLIQGAGAGAPRVVSMSLIRDRYQDGRLARTVSLVSVVFGFFPIVAPLIGQLLLSVGPWRGLFGALSIVGCAMLLWTSLRLSESLPAERRRPLSWSALRQGARSTFSVPLPAACIVVMALTMGANYAYIATAKQIMVDTFAAGDRFALLYGLIAAMVAVAGLINFLLLRIATPTAIARRAIQVGALLNAAYLVIVWSGKLTLGEHVFFQTASMFLFGLIQPNLHSIAIRTAGDAVGTASAFIGATSTATGALIGFFAGQLVSTRLVGITASYLVLSLLAVLVVGYARRALARATDPSITPKQ